MSKVVLVSSSAPSLVDDSVPPSVSRWGGILGGLVFLAILLSPTPEGLSPAGQRMAAITALMGIFWVAQVLPMEVTSLLPLVLFPLLGVQSAKEVSAAYFSDSSFLYLGGFILALGVERWGLHRRFALNIVATTGTGVRRIVFGFMFATFAISMWISNTAAAMLMLPIALALLTSLDQMMGQPLSTQQTAEQAPQLRRFGMALMLGIGYSATLGGMATVVGTPTNVVYLEVITKQFPEAPPLSAAEWMLTWAPMSFSFLIVTWLVVTWRLKTPPLLSLWDRHFFRSQLEQLGPWKAGERWMLGIFFVTATLWITRTGVDFGDGYRLQGWSVWAEQWLNSLGVAKSRQWINDSTVAMTTAVLLFAISIRSAPGQPRQPLMDWSTASRLPWGILLLFGGGFAIAEASRTSGLAEWTGEMLATSVADWPLWLVIAVVALLVTFLSEFTSNVATANALLPILAGLAVALKVDPRLLMLPATLAASNGFMLPIGTPPNAIVFGTGRIRMTEMVTRGFVLDVLGVALIVVATYTLLIPQLGIQLHGLPDWATLPSVAP